MNYENNQAYAALVSSRPPSAKPGRLQFWGGWFAWDRDAGLPLAGAGQAAPTGLGTSTGNAVRVVTEDIVVDLLLKYCGFSIGILAR